MNEDTGGGGRQLLAPLCHSRAEAPGETVVPSLPRRQVVGPPRKARQGPAANLAASIYPGR